MTSLRPESAAAMTAHRREAVRLAKAQEKAVSDKCIRSGQPVPGYTFDELIGKGSFGRVYKGRETSSRKVVAVKVLDIDDADFQAFGDMKDEQIRDFNKEIQILRRAQESGAENLNQMIEAFAVHSQLWMVCEYCPGGSVKTLMRATRDRLEEKYLIVVARELAKALKGLHQAGIMHRDVKAANVLIHETGGLQLCDFGIAAALEGHTDKRRTFVGTFHWMPPELWADKPEYSDEVDVWGYGCTLYECAMGTPPNSDVRERQQLKVRMRRLKQSIGLPEKEKFSEGLRSLVKFALNPDAASRPSMQDILQHEFLADTEETFPNRSLAELVQHYYGWLFGGGHRVSLFMPGGAAAASEAPEEMASNMADEWNFSMTQDFEHRMSTILELPDMSEIARNFEFGEGETTPKATTTNAIPSPPKEMTATEKANFELRVKRGADLNYLFDQAAPSYEYKNKRDFVPIREPEARRISDLPFRAMAEERPSSIASVAIDLGDFDEDDYAIAAPKTADDRIQTTYAAATPQKEEPAFILPDAATIRAKRADSKGPRDPTAQDSTARPDSSYQASSDPTTEDCTARKGPELQAAAEITPTQRPAAKPRDTMGWSFADAMSEMHSSGEDSTSANTSPQSTSADETALDQKTKKHATMEWSFSMAMAEAKDTPEEPTGERTPGRLNRPAPLHRMMTTPVTSHELHDAYDEFGLSSRPSTSMSDAYSESDQSSTDFDPFGLDRRTPYDDDDEGMPGDAELEDIGINDFYNARGHTMIPPDMSGPGPDIPHSVVGLGLNGHVGTYSGGHSAQPGEESPEQPLTASLSTSRRPDSPREPYAARGPGHNRANGSGASHLSASSVPSHRSTGSGSSTSSTRTSHQISTSVSGASVSSGSDSVSAAHPGGTSRQINLTIPAPPSMAAMAYDASPTIVSKELERLLGNFQDALGAVSDLIAGDIAERLSEDSRGRTRRRMIIESGSEWEDEE